MMLRQKPRTQKRKKPVIIEDCYYCTTASDIDFLNVDTFKRSVSSYAKILPRHRTGNCSRHQRKVAQAIKHARYLALLRYTNR